MTEANHSMLAYFFGYGKIAHRTALNHIDVQTLKTSLSNLPLGSKTNNLTKIPDFIFLPSHRFSNIFITLISHKESYTVPF